MDSFSPKDWVEVRNVEDILLTDIDSPYFVIVGNDRNSLEENKIYKVKSLAYLRSGFIVEVAKTFVTNSRPRLMSGRRGCDVTPRKGIVLTTEFNVSCFGWIDDDLPLIYQFR